MPWTQLGNSITLTTDWQYTTASNAEYFRFRHSYQNFGQLYQVCSAQRNDDGTTDFYDTDARTLVVDVQNDCLHLPMPPCFTSRVIALRKVSIQPSFEQQIRNLFVPSAFINQLPVSSFYPTDPSYWAVAVDSNNSVSNIPALIAALQADVDSKIAAEETDVDTQLLAIKAKLDQLPAGGSGGGSGSSATTGHTLTYVSDGDNNGAFYWIGRNYGTTTWSNPVDAGSLLIAANTIGGGTVNTLVDRSPSGFFTSGQEVGDYIMFDLGANHSLVPNYYSLQTRNSSSGYYLRNWKIQGSSNGTGWTDLDTQANNQSLTQNSQWLSLPVGNVSAAYRYLRLLCTGANSDGAYHIVLGEVEFYGSFQ